MKISKTTSGVTAVLVALVMMFSGSAFAGAYGKQKVVYHINNIHSATGALRNAKNHLNAVGDHVEEHHFIVLDHRDRELGEAPAGRAGREVDRGSPEARVVERPVGP